jgi:hypothetical protein
MGNTTRAGGNINATAGGDQNTIYQKNQKLKKSRITKDVEKAQKFLLDSPNPLN